MDAKKINRVTWVMLGLGMTSAVVVYFTAQPEVLDPLLGDQFQSKRYLHDLGVIGGKSNVMTVEFIEWVKSLFRGQALAGTIAAMTILVTLGYRFFASLPDPDAPVPDAQESSERVG